MTSSYVRRILRARVYDVALETPLTHAANLSTRLENTVLLKREDLQPIFSFKVRGASNRLNELLRLQTADAPVRGVVTASAGNHGMGVAMAATKLGIKSTIVMPQTTPQIKVETVRALGGRAVLHGDQYDDACQHAEHLSSQRGHPMIHAFDHPDVIAGQGTIGVELCRQHPQELHAVFVPIGGGGLAAGIALYMKYLRPEVKIIGVEPDDANAMQLSLARGRRTRIKQPGLFADGVALKQPGRITYPLLKRHLDGVILCSVAEICAAIKDVFYDTRVLLEPSGALSIAGMKKYIASTGCTRRTMIAVASGANINFDRLRHVAERADLGEHREALLCVSLSEQPGAFHQFCRLLGGHAITEFSYRYADAKEAKVFVGISTSAGESTRRAIIEKLTSAKHAVLDLTDDELANSHVRYMVGGRAPNLQDERLYRFDFPERPGALLQFLKKMGDQWNITLFHYRNHGASHGWVLLGVQVPEAQMPRYQRFLEGTGYNYRAESDSVAYQSFLR